MAARTGRASTVAPSWRNTARAPASKQYEPVVRNPAQEAGFFFVCTEETLTVRAASAWLLLLALCAAAALFACGLPGGFQLDDYPNLAALELVERGAGFARFYVFESPTGFPGRPLSNLSFLLQYRSWPGHPEAFKAVNIALHLANGALLYWVFARTARLAGRPDAALLAAMAAALWLVHPLQISTVLYVVQRMTELAALLSLAAIAAYLRGRELGAAGRTRAGFAWMSAAVAIGAPLAVLAKENG